MSSVKTFIGIRPVEQFCPSVIVQPDVLSYSRGVEEELISNPHSFLHLLRPLIVNKFQQAGKNELMYKKVSENLQSFVDKGLLIKESRSCFYIFQIQKGGEKKTGLWALTALDDYLDDRIKIHENTRTDNEKRLSEYIAHTGVNANPVLLAYPPNTEINKLLNINIEKAPVLKYCLSDSQYRLWAVEGEAEIKKIEKAFAKISTVYLADGHHRIAAFAEYGSKRKSHNSNHHGNEGYNFFSSIYFPSDQLDIYPFHRMVEDLNAHTEKSFLQAIEKDFVLKQSENAVLPDKKGNFGLYLKGNWYSLSLRKSTEKGAGPVDQLDVNVLQDHILGPLLNINNPRTDKRIRFVGGPNPIKEYIEMVDKQEMKALFTLCPISFEELKTVVDSGGLMPPKSTFFEPKIDLGILTHYIP